MWRVACDDRIGDGWRKEGREDSGNWKIQWVDSGAIRGTQGLGLGEDKTDSIVKEKMDHYLSEGYEPFAASTYGGSRYNNEHCFFFRKKS